MDVKPIILGIYCLSSNTILENRTAKIPDYFD